MSGGVLVCIQPRRTKRPFIVLRSQGQRRPVVAVINSASEAVITAAEAAIDAVISKQLFSPVGRTNDHYRVRLASPHQLHRYLHTGQRPPRFPAGGRQRLLSLWKSRTPGTQIEVTEFMSIIAMRAVDIT